MKQSYRDLYIWQAAVALAADIVNCTESFPSRQRFVLTAQIQRCAISVPSNIAEGKGRLTQRELRHFLGIARGSLFELATQLEIATRLKLLSQDEASNLTNQIGQIGAGINNLLRHIRDADHPSTAQ